MVQVNFSQLAFTEPGTENPTAANGKHEGILKLENQEYSLFFFSDSGEVTEEVAKFLQEANQQDPSLQLSDLTFIHITQQVVENELEMMQFFQELETDQTLQKETHTKEPLSETKYQPSQQKTELIPPRANTQTFMATFTNKRHETSYSSLFSLARSFHSTSSDAKQKDKQEHVLSKKEFFKETSIFSLSELKKAETPILQENRYEREGNEKQHKEDQEQHKEKDKEKDSGKGQDQGQGQREKEESQQNKQKEKDKKIPALKTTQANTQNSNKNPSSSGKDLKASSTDSAPKADSPPPASPSMSVDSIFIRFMALMARILGQAEFEAHQLYLRIKERTDAIDVLTLFISKLNSEKSSIDWTKNEEMKKLVEKARALGVEIPEGKYKWSDDEKKLLKETVQMRKDSLEKMTQLERTDMQRYLQEASQCHQARSNTLKILKEVTDTIIHNMRPG